MLDQAQITAAEKKGIELRILKVVETNQVFCLAHGGELPSGASYLGEANSAICFCCCMTRYQLDSPSTSTTIAALHEILALLFE